MHVPVVRPVHRQHLSRKILAFAQKLAAVIPTDEELLRAGRQLLEARLQAPSDKQSGGTGRELKAGADLVEALIPGV